MSARVEHTVTLIFKVMFVTFTRVVVFNIIFSGNSIRSRRPNRNLFTPRWVKSAILHRGRMMMSRHVSSLVRQHRKTLSSLTLSRPAVLKYGFYACFSWKYCILLVLYSDFVQDNNSEWHSRWKTNKKIEEKTRCKVNALTNQATEIRQIKCNRITAVPLWTVLSFISFTNVSAETSMIELLCSAFVFYIRSILYFPHTCTQAEMICKGCSDTLKI